MKLTRNLLGGAGIALLLTALAPIQSTMAAAPANDNFADRTTIGIGDTTIDLTEATVESHDSQVFQGCRSPGASNSVWYELDLVGVNADLIALSAFDANFSGLEYQIVQGTPGNFTKVTCMTGTSIIASTIKPVTDATYYLVAYDWNGPPSTSLPRSVTLRVSALQHPVITAAPTFRDSNWFGAGTYSCREPYDFIGIDFDIAQRLGRSEAHAYGFAAINEPVCDGNPHPWEAPAGFIDGTLTSGPAIVGLTTDLVLTDVIRPGVGILDGDAPSVSATIRHAGKPAFGQALPNAIDTTLQPGTIVDGDGLLLTVRSPAVADRPGGVSLSGDYRCDPAGASRFIYMEFDGYQLVGPRTARAFGSTIADQSAPPFLQLDCDSTTRPWSVRLAPVGSARIRGGEFFTRAFAVTVDADLNGLNAFEGSYRLKAIG